MKNRTYILWMLLILVILLWGIFPFVLGAFVPIEKVKEIYGETYGALNTLFSGLAFAGLIYTIVQQNIQLKMQKEELSLQRRELELTRIELNRSASAQESTEKSITNQAKLMEYSCRLDALKTLYQTYMEHSVNSSYNHLKKDEFRNKAVEIEKNIEALIKSLTEMTK